MFPWKPLWRPLDIESEIDRAFSELIHKPWGRQAGEAAWQPDIDIYETDKAYLIQADLPGVSPNDLEVLLEEEWVTISGTRGSATLVRSAHGVRLERQHGHFSRRFHLRHAVDKTAVEIQHKEGVVYIRLPKLTK